MNIREWNSLENVQDVHYNQRGNYDDIFEFFTLFYYMMVFEKSFIFNQPDSLGDLEIDGLDEHCKKLFREFLSSYASACVDEVISWCLDRELVILLSSNELSEIEKTRVYMFWSLLKKTLRKKMFGSLLDNFYSVESIINEFGSSSIKQSCSKKLREIEMRLAYLKEIGRFDNIGS